MIIPLHSCIYEVDIVYVLVSFNKMSTLSLALPVNARLSFMLKVGTLLISFQLYQNVVRWILFHKT